MALSGWDNDKKLKLTIDSSNVDEDLTNFPVLVTLSSGTGQSNFDTTRVFDELDGGIDNTTKLMLHMDDTALSDSSPSSHSITKNGDAVRSATQSKFGGYSVYFAGTGDYLSLVDSDDWDFGLGDFTIDWWMRRVTTFGSGKDIFNCNFPTNPNWLVYFYSGTLYFFHNGASIYTVSYSEVLNVWEHYAVVRSGDNMYYFVDGVQIGSTGTGHVARSINGANFLKIGGGRGGAADSNCYMDGVRISKGVAIWTSNFTPPTSAYTDDRRKIAITDSNDNQLYTEIERWDYANEEANLWVKVPTIASGTDTNLYLYYDATVSDQNTRPDSEAYEDFTGVNGSYPDSHEWRVIGAVYPTIQNNKLRTSIDGTYTSCGVSPYFGMIDDFSTVQIDYDIDTGPATTSWSIFLEMRTGSADDMIRIDRRYDGGHKYYFSYYTGGSWYGGANAVTSDTSGKLRLERVGDVFHGYYWAGSSWTELGSGYTVSTDSALKPRILTSSWGSNPTIVIDVDNFTVSGTVSGYIDDIGTIPAWGVWDSNFKAVYHMSQDPDGDASDAIKDSTPNVNHGTPGGTMLTEDLVDSQVGKGLDFDGTDDYIDVGNGESLSFGAPADTFTLESIVKTSDSNSRIVCRSRQIDTHMPYNLRVAGGYAKFQRWNQPGGEDAFTDTNIIVNDNVFHYVAFKNINASDHRLFVDGIDVKDDTTTWTYDNTTTQKTFIGRWQNSTYGDAWGTGIIDEIRISNIDRSNAWLKATYYSGWNNFITFAEPIVFIFSNPIPVDTTVYGTTQNLYLTVTVSGGQPSYIYDATFYDALDDGIIGSTVSGTSSGQMANELMTTSSGIDYSWYVTAVSSGVEDTSSIYTFTNRFLCEGYVEVSDVPASGIPVRLYLRSTGEYVGGTTSAGVSGTFEIETTHNAYHYAVALYDYSTTNALIEDWLIPSN